MPRRLHGTVLALIAAILAAFGALAAPARASGPELQAGGPAALAERARAEGVTSYGPAMWMRIPRIGIDSDVADVGLVGSVYDVPWQAVGRHFDSANPGEQGNSVFNGHVLTVSAGRVFQRLEELQPGDAVYVYTPTHRTDWVVESVYSVPDGDDSFVEPTPDTRITLYTCTGSFSPLEQNFSHRLVVVGRLVQAVPRS